MGGEPELRAGPPWAMEEMIAAEPDLCEPIAGARADAARIAEAIAVACDAGQPVVVTGCGTSEHAAMVVAELLREARPGPSIFTRQAFEAALDPAAGGVCLAISHEGETAATLAAVVAASRAGAVTALLTAAPLSRGARMVDHRFVTPVLDRSWCHTVGYLSPIIAGGAIASALGGATLDGAWIKVRLREILATQETAEGLGGALHDVDRLVVVGSGLDRIAARELALKIEEGVHVPAVGRDLETELHGHLVSADERCGLVVIALDPAASDRRAARAADLLRACRRLGMPTTAIVTSGISAAWPDPLTSVGRLVLPGASPAGRVAASLSEATDAAVALQLLAVGVIHAAGTNPDLIRREDAAYREAAALADPAAG